MRAALVPLTILLLAGGCTQPADHPPPGAGIEKPECPLTAEPQAGTVPIAVGEYNVSRGDGQRGASSYYDDFEWDWPARNVIAMSVRAEWDSGATGEKTLQLRVFDAQHGIKAYASAYGVSPIILNFTMAVPDDADLAVSMEPHSETAGMPIGVAVNKQAFETHVTMVQTLLCEEAAE